MFARFILFLVIGLIVWGIFRGLWRKPARDAAAALKPAKTSAGEDMVTCARCGVNLPRSEAINDNGVFRCHDNPRCPPA